MMRSCCAQMVKVLHASTFHFLFSPKSMNTQSVTLVSAGVPETTQTKLVLKFSGLVSGKGVELFNTATALQLSSMNITGFTAAAHSTYKRNMD